jgi:hypothetical protein
MIKDVEFDRLFDAYDEFCADVGDNDGDGVGDGPIDGGSDNELDDGDFLSQLLCHTKAELLVGTAKGLTNFEMVKKLVEENIYEQLKGCLKHWTVLHFILKLLTLKAKRSWSDSSFNDLLQRSLSVRSRWVWKEFMHVQIIVFCIMGILSKT